MLHFVEKWRKSYFVNFLKIIEVRIKKCRLLNKSRRNISKLQEYPTYM